MTKVVKFTDAQAEWLYMILTRGMDGFFENNPRERKLCDNCAKAVNKSLEGY